jgi:hypothetical protein
LKAKGKVYAADGPPTDQQIDEIKSKFDKFDNDGSGEIDAKELSALIKQVTGQDFDTDEMDEAMAQMDPDRSGSVSWLEFKKWFFDDGTDDNKEGGEEGGDKAEESAPAPAPAPSNGKDDGEIVGANEGVFDNKIS